MSDVNSGHPTDVSDHLARQQCARQWRHFLHALAAEFATALSPADLRTLSRRIGLRFATELPLPPQPTLDGVQAAMSRQWQDLDWGWVSLVQHTDHVEINHFCSPLTAAFGAPAVDWATGFLEGVYQQWFEQQGAPGLSVSQTQATDGWGSVSFRLGR